MEVKSLEIDILYAHPLGYTTTFYRICHGQDSISSDQSTLESLWNADGGLELTINGHFTIFKSNEFHHLLEVISFLLSGLCLVEGIALEEKLQFFNPPENNMISRPLYDQARSRLELTIANSKEIAISWRADAPIGIYRYDHTFENFLIPKDLWVAEVCHALKDFFHVYKLIHDEASAKDAMYTDYLRLWEYIRAKLKSN